MTASSAPDVAAAPALLPEAELRAIREDFPILTRQVRGATPLIYLDSGATTQRPAPVLRAMHEFATGRNAAVHRGAHALAEEATEDYEQARAGIAGYYGTAPEEIVFTSGTTAAINLLASSISGASQGGGGQAARRFALLPGDRIVVTQAEHHSNLVPWQELAARTGAELAWLRVGPDGRLRLDDLDTVITPRTRILAFTHASNVTGAVSDVATIVAAARRVGALTVLDAAQTAGHLPVNLSALGVDFAAFSAHKTLGPHGVGALYGRLELLEALPPGFFGGSMVEIVTMTEATFQPPPTRFEAGTQPVTEAIGWAAALAYLAEIGPDRVAAHEAALTQALLRAIAGLEGVRLLGPTDLTDRLGCVAVAFDGVHPHDAGQYLDSLGFAVRVGHHCAQPVHRALGVHTSTRATFGVYNTLAEVEAYGAALGTVRAYFGEGR
ncbi:MAG: SufS family cysteine desulfurase [Bifidobacteriaceae bacterium]|jgi:cysteine desulfurase/selenocysteine lyase|nr:SufS family cysteine desulfurase [Bifidobacteriaceae bacterium]